MTRERKVEMGSMQGRREVQGVPSTQMHLGPVSKWVHSNKLQVLEGELGQKVKGLAVD
jgi:hypothetical protein